MALRNIYVCVPVHLLAPLRPDIQAYATKRVRVFYFITCQTTTYATDWARGRETFFRVCGKLFARLNSLAYTRSLSHAYTQGRAGRGRAGQGKRFILEYKQNWNYSLNFEYIKAQRSLVSFISCRTKPKIYQTECAFFAAVFCVCIFQRGSPPTTRISNRIYILINLF